MTRKKEIQKELEELAPSLAKLKTASQQNSTEIPEGYFENLSAKVESQIFDEGIVKKENKSRVIKLWWFTGVAVAASISLFVLTNTSKVEISYPELETLSANEQLVIEELDAYDMEYLLEAELIEDDIDAEELLIEENHLEDLINI
jgi:hypothetical protein